jgi:glycosyltransferase involved in cell wall biosynthesis
MNILVVCHDGLYRDLSASFVHGQTQAYAKLGHRVRVIIPVAVGKPGPDSKRFGPAVLRREADGVELYYVRYVTLSRFGTRWFNHAAACAAVGACLRTLLRDFTPQVIHAHTLGFDTRIGAWLKKRLGIPLVVTTHGSDASIPFEQGDLAFLRKHCDLADTVVAVSSALAQKVRACGTATPVRVIMNGFRLNHVPESREKVPVSLIQVGNLQEQKRVHITIEAFSRLLWGYPEATLTIVGSGPQREDLEALCRDLGIADRVTFTGRLPNDQTLEQMAKTQFFVMPSIREGFGIVYAEAMACGCVAIGTQGEGIADLIVSGENGYLVPPDDPEAIVETITACLQQPESMRAVANAGRAAALQLTWEVNAAQYLQLFQEGGGIW